MVNHPEIRDERPWWMENNLRLIQCNLRETDATMDVDRLISDIKAFHANTLMVGAGGIAALYPTRLPYQYTSPYLKSDLLGEILEKCHKEGIRVIARFDFSKAHVSFLEEHPDWFYRSAAGGRVNFNDMVHTCVNGPYQREKSLGILKEVLTTYPVDGIFFNMFGYQTRDYSENYHGICRCDSCQSRFLEMYGHELPQDENSPCREEYEAFKKVTVQELLDSIHGLVKNISPDIAICTYTDYKVDIVRNESNSALTRPLPFWIYSASDNVMSVEGSFEDKIVSNCAINAADIFYRFMGVSRHLTKIRLLQNMASGSGLDFCIIGVFEDYPETEPFEDVKETFLLHKKYEAYLSRLESTADILLIKPDRETEEYRGLFKMLKEAHLIFDVVALKALNTARRDYRWVLAPSVTFDPAYFSEKTNVLATSDSFQDRKDWLSEWFGATPQGQEKQNKGAYLDAQNKKIFKRLPLRDWVILDEKITLCRFEDETLLPYLPPARYGPPERCGGTKPSGFGAAGVKNHGNRKMVLLPWRVGFLYYRHGYQEHRDILLDLLDLAAGEKPLLQVEAPDMVEVFLNRCPGGYLLQMVNLTGFNGTTFFEPLPLSELKVRLGNTAFKSVTRLSDNENVSWTTGEGMLAFTVDTLKDYEAYYIS